MTYWIYQDTDGYYRASQYRMVDGSLPVKMKALDYARVCQSWDEGYVQRRLRVEYEKARAAREG